MSTPATERRLDPLLNKTIDREDLNYPPVARTARNLSQMARWMWCRGIPFAVNGVLRMRLRIRWHKLWEYARGLAFCRLQPGMRILDFGGAATVPAFWLSRAGYEVLSVDTDQRLCAHTARVARTRRWNIRCVTEDLSHTDPPAAWGAFDRILSFCVIEHIPKELQPAVLSRLAGLLRSQGLLVLTFDYGPTAPVPDAVRDPEDLQRLVAASGLAPVGNSGFIDTEERFRLDRKHPDRAFTLGSVFLAK